MSGSNQTGSVPSAGAAKPSTLTAAQTAGLPPQLQQAVQQNGYTPPPAPAAEGWLSKNVSWVGPATIIALVAAGVILGIVGRHHGWW